MIKKLKNYFLHQRNRQRVSICLSKGCAMMLNRKINLTQPSTWEFSGFSQNGEDGIIDVLRSQLNIKNRYFIEIGAADGIDNNSAWMLVAEKYNGIMVEGNPALSNVANELIAGYSIGADVMNLFVSTENLVDIKKQALYLNPDVMSLDIDGNDYYIANKLFSLGFRPKIFVVEYNSVFGPEKSITIMYNKDFMLSKADKNNLYYGVSIQGWRLFFEKVGYRFITVDQNGVNAFFVDEKCFDSEFLNNINSLDFAENQFQLNKFRVPSSEQFKLIQDLSFYSIT